MIADVAERMTRRLDNANGEAVKRQRRLFGDRAIDAGNSIRFCLGANHLAAIVRFQRCDAAGVVGVMMGRENGVEWPVARLERGAQRGPVGCVYRGSLTATGRVDDNPVVVGQTGDQNDFKRAVHGRILGRRSSQCQSHNRIVRGDPSGLYGL